MEFVGEHLAIGKIGNTFVILSFVFALLASISYFFASRENDEALSWKKIARISFRLHSLSVFGILGTLFVMLWNHYFEYQYVWQHSNREMPMRYILSCFWEGQEGSFLLWTFWHCVIGLILQRTAKEWEAPVMTTIALVQVFLASMLLGINISDYHLGSNPFTILIRENPDFKNFPFFQIPDYLQKIEHVPGFSPRGLNPLLQNYWMTIHPPTLFLGFALTVVPFAYAIAGLWKKKFNEWLKPALSWTFAGVAVLGVGILMGGAWAYEALSFGGFWAWDPVENASLVPWLTLVGAAHLMLINRNKGQSLFTAFFLAILTFILILYSTFLTRSGILGETSVHAFTDLGMSGQLLVYLFFFMLISIVLLFARWKHFPRVTEEEGVWSREFWMFVGAVVLLVSSFQIMFYTSIPVWNKIFGMNKAPLKEVIKFYNNWQLPFAFVVTLLIAVGQFFKYKNTDVKEFYKRIAVPFVISIVLAIGFAFLIGFHNRYYSILLFSSIFAVVANFHYMIRVLRGKIRKAGASIAHIGFGLVLLGALVSTSKKDIFSFNTSGTSIESLSKDISGSENSLLTEGDTLNMGPYWVTFTGRRKEGINVFFDVDYFTRDEHGNYKKEFSLAPRLQLNPRMGNVAEPDTRHFPTFDVYTHVTYALVDFQKKDKDSTDDYGAPSDHSLKKGDSLYSAKSLIIFDSLSTAFDRSAYKLEPNDIAVMAHMRALVMEFNNTTKKLQAKTTYPATPVYVIHNNTVRAIPDTINELGIRLNFWEINPQDGKIKISMQEKKENEKDFIVMQAIKFPYINILWIGCIVMAIGTILSILERLRRQK
ncbi:MAG: heme lyase CcmF/NrfE family subunit [Bacteroidia bacterium]